MPAWGWIVLAAAILAVLLIGWMVWSKRRTGRLRTAFGPEYDHTMTESGKRRAAESELTARRKRREELDIRPLAPASRQRYLVMWKETQARFVDAPSDAIHQADLLVLDVMRERGYPMESFDQRSADISVDYPRVVESYRAAHAISLANDHSRATTEDLRQGFVHYRALFEELLSTGDAQAERQAR